VPFNFDILNLLSTDEVSLRVVATKTPLQTPLRVRRSSKDGEKQNK
jgi:hypothetical protein